MSESGQSWKLEDSVAKSTQGFVVTGYGALEKGTALFLEIPVQGGGNWLAELQKHFPVTAAFEVGGGADVECAISVAFTWSGLNRMGLSETALASFSTPFKEGMFQEDRLRRLGDRRNGEWLDTTGKKQPLWSGNIPSQRREKRVGAYDVELDDDAERVTTGITVHAMVLVYAKDAQDADGNTTLENIIGNITKILEEQGVRIVHQLPLVLDIEGGKFSREHFGFADGLSQPVPHDDEGALKSSARPDPVQGVPLGEVMIGYKNGHQEVAPGPVVYGAQDDRPKQAGLAALRSAQGFFDLGQNGSYLVVRELQQDVPAFWQSMEKAAGIIRDADAEAKHVDGKWVAERVVGRTEDGHVLQPEGPRKPGKDNHPDSDFLFYDDDQQGTGCPIGSHIRRAFPRDTLAPEPSMKSNLLGSANNHRILRRGRKYGPAIKDRMKDDGDDRGLLFMCLNTDIARQFEFVQQTWLLNSDFGTLFEEVDPLIGADGWMTIPQDGLRRRVHVQTFVHMMGGEYFFLPSIPAIKYLSQL